MPLSREAIKKLRIVQEQILATPEFYDQNVYAEVTGTGCDTVCCIAGWLDYNEFGPKEHLKHVAARGENEYDFFKEACTILGVEENEGIKLVGTSYAWSEPFCTQYEKATTPKQRAKVAVARIEQFIEDCSDPEG